MGCSNSIALAEPAAPVQPSRKRSLPTTEEAPRNPVQAQDTEATETVVADSKGADVAAEEVDSAAACPSGPQDFCEEAAVDEGSSGENLADTGMFARAGNVTELLLALSSAHHPESVDLEGRVFKPPEECTPNSRAWLSTEIWPHQNYSTEDLQTAAQDGPLFSLSAQGPAAESMICLVPAGCPTWCNGTLKQPPHAVLVFDGSCSGVQLTDVIIHGGAVVCCGSGCDVKFNDCCFQCNLVVMASATVTLQETKIALYEDGKVCEERYSDDEPPSKKGVAVFVTGAGTKLEMIGGRTLGGLQGVTVQDGAHFITSPFRGLPEEMIESCGYKLIRPHVESFVHTGVDVWGNDSILEPSFLDVSNFERDEVDGKALCAMHVHSNSKAVLSNVGFGGDYVHCGLKVNGTTHATLYQCAMEGLKGTGVNVHLLNGGSATLTECWLRVDKSENLEAGDEHKVIGLLVEGQGSTGKCVKCRIEPYKFDEPEAASTTVAVITRSHGVVEANQCYIKGQMMSEGSAELSMLERVEQVEEDMPSSPAYMGCFSCFPEEVTSWNGLDPPSTESSE